MWNRWHTHRRHQEAGAADDFCAFGCSAHAPGSTEHYLYCPVMRRVAFNSLDFTRNVLTRRAFFLVEPELQDDTSLGRVALLVYAVYRAVHTFRLTRPGTPTEAYDLMSSYLQHAATGDSAAERLLDWAKIRRVRHASQAADEPP